MSARTGAWFAYQPDWSGFKIFGNEIDALRYAVELTMKVGFLPFGADHTQIQESRSAS